MWNDTNEARSSFFSFWTFTLASNSCSIYLAMFFLLSFFTHSLSAGVVIEPVSLDMLNTSFLCLGFASGFAWLF